MPKSVKINISKNIFNQSYLNELEQYDKRINVYYGGGGSGKSHFVVQKIIYKLLKFPNRKCLVVRKVGNTLRDSVYALFKTVLSDWQLYDSSECRDSLLTIKLITGSEILFKGLDDPEKIKSIANIDDIVIEEATDLTIDDFTQLNLRLRSKNPHNQIHLMFNPVSKSNWVYKQWFASDSVINTDTTTILKTTYKDNKFLPTSYIRALEEMKNTNPAYYSIYALGEFASLDKLVYTNWEIEDFDRRQILKDNSNVDAVFGLDFGYTADPTAFVCVLVDRTNKYIWVFDEFQERGLLNNEIAEKIIKMGYGKEIITADSSEPKSIEDLKRNGLTRVRGAKKGRDSILNGIQNLQQYKIVVKPECFCLIEELRNYTWIKDKDNNYINKPIDRHNHGLDALRYAIESKSVGEIKVYDNWFLYR